MMQLILSVRDDWKDRFDLPAEDYLHGLISLVNELVHISTASSQIAALTKFI